jgi:outer membrane protein assembly factor BamB
MPATLAGVVHARSPVVPFLAPVAGANALLYVSDDTGSVTAVDADTGLIAWGPEKPAGSDSMRGAPGGVFTQYSGSRDLVLVGSISPNPTVDPSEFYGISIDGLPVIDPVLETFNGVNTMGAVLGSPAVDYAADRVYVTSNSLSGGDTVWSIRLSNFSVDWSQNVGSISTSPVLRGGRIYVGNDSEEVYFLDIATSGTPSPPFGPTSDGNVKGFVWPDRRNTNLYFATNTTVWSIRDAGSDLQPNWTWNGGGGVEPGMVLHWPQTDYLYVGGKDGKLYQLDFSGGAPTNACVPAPSASTCLYIQLGDGQDRLGAPSLDIGVEPPDVTVDKKLLHIGSESGVIYAVEVPF